VGKLGIFERPWVAFCVKILVNGLKSDKASLAALHHAEPDNQEPKDKERGDRRYTPIRSAKSLFLKYGSHNDNHSEDEESERANVFNTLDTGANHRSMLLVRLDLLLWFLLYIG
jgi:hypothetical protein